MSRFARFLSRNKNIILFFVLYCVGRTAYADWASVPSGSMEPTIYPGDYLLIDKMAFGPSVPFLNVRLINWGSPDRGDIITFVPPHTDDLYVKRVVGLPGDVIEWESDIVRVNGEVLPHTLTHEDSDVVIVDELIGDQPHAIQFSLNRAIYTPYQQVTVPAGKYFVMGDHRNSSADSREWGFVDEGNITGKVSRLAVSFADDRGFLDSIGQRLK